MSGSAPSLQVGVVFPTTEIGRDPIAIRDFAQTTEELGVHHLLTYDHVVGAQHEGRHPRLNGPYDELDEFHEPFVLFGYLAGLTRRLELMTGVLVLPQRQTALVAKQAAEVDVLSLGRLRLGVGLGWNRVEYDVLGVPFEGRGARIDEQIAVLRALWEEPLVELSGAFHAIDRVGILPRPHRRIPVWYAVATARAAERATRIADGALFPSAAKEVCTMASKIGDVLERNGRNVDEFGLECIIDAEGGPARWATEVERWRRVGGTHVCLRTCVVRAGSNARQRQSDSIARQLDAVTKFMEMFN
jgi:probable F420-dependent oxidoreductase